MSRLRKYLPFLVSLLCLLAAAPCGAQDARARLHMLNVFLATPLDSRALEQEKVRKIRAVELQARDEFETQAMFEKRKAEASSRVKEIEQEYAQKLAEARRKFDQRIAEITKEREQLLLAGTDVASPFTVGSYDADKQQFTVALSKTGQSFPLPMPLQVARQFKTASGTLTATGKQYLAADESYDYADWQVTFEGRTCRFGPQKGVQQIASTVKVQPAAPPSLKTTVSFAEPSGNLKLDANETAELTVTIVNNGRGSAFGFEINATLEHASDVEISSPSYVGEIPAGQTRTAKLTIKGGIGVTDGVASCLLSYNEANGFAPAGNKITFETKALIPPRLVLIPGVRVDDLGKTGKIRPGEQVSITARIQNTGLGEAKRVRIRIASGDPNVFFAPGAKTEDDVASMPSGAYHDITFSIFTNLQATSVPVEITATESYGKYGILSQVLPLSFDKQIAGIEELTVKGREDQHGDVKIAGGLSIDVDEDIPKAGVKNADAVALVIGISRYKNPDVPTVDYARHGAAIMKDYLVSALGYDNKRIIYAEDENAGLADFKKMFQKLTNMVRPGRSDVFVYYNGHGAPDTKTNEAFVVPYDCDPTYASETGFPMSEFYSLLAKLPAKSVTVVLDACFSGSSPKGLLFKGVSPALLKVRNPVAAIPNGVVFSSSSENQLSNWYPEKRHGLFTYYFLKALQGYADANKDKQLTVREVEEYLRSNVPDRAREQNREQMPQVVGDKDRVVVKY